MMHTQLNVAVRLSFAMILEHNSCMSFSARRESKVLEKVVKMSLIGIGSLI